MNSPLCNLTSFLLWNDLISRLTTRGLAGHPACRVPGICKSSCKVQSFFFKTVNKSCPEKSWEGLLTARRWKEKQSFSTLITIICLSSQMVRFKSLLILDQEQSDLGPRSFFTVLQNILSCGVFPPPACSLSVSWVPEAEATPGIWPAARMQWDYPLRSSPPLPVVGRWAIMKERERLLILCPGLGAAHHLLSKVWQCPHDHPGNWPFSGQSS